MNLKSFEETGVEDVRRVCEQIARQHAGDLAAHVAETNRIAEEVRRRLALDPVVPPPRSPWMTAETARLDERDAATEPPLARRRPSRYNREGT